MRARRLLIIGMSLLLASCALVRGGPEFGPEQAQFVVEPGLGSGPAGEEVAGEALDSVNVSYRQGSVEHLGSVSTPGGRVDFIAFESDDEDGRIMSCDGRFSDFGGSWGCGPVNQSGASTNETEALIVTGGGGNDDWSEADLMVPAATVHLTAVAQDGRSYDLRPFNGRAFVMWPTRRGDLTITAYGVDGEPLDTVRVDAVP